MSATTRNGTLAVEPRGFGQTARRDAWWTVLLVDPLASRMVLPVANRTDITPNQITIVSFAVGLLSAAAFTQGDHPWLVLGALLYHLSFVLDYMDGKIAIDPMITHVLSLDEINKGFDLMHAGESIRSVIVY